MSLSPQKNHPIGRIVRQMGISMSVSTVSGWHLVEDEGRVGWWIYCKAICERGFFDLRFTGIGIHEAKENEAKSQAGERHFHH